MKDYCDITEILAMSRGLNHREASVLWDAFLPKLIVVIKAKLRNSQLRVTDEDDIAQNAMLSLFNGLQNKQFDTVRNSDELWKLLVTITARKIVAQQRYELAQKRGSGKVRGESVFNHPQASDLDGIGQIIDPNLLPESAENVLQTYAALLPDIGDENSLKTIMLRMEGFTNQEIAEKMACSVSRVEQRIAKVRLSWIKAEVS